MRNLRPLYFVGFTFFALLTLAAGDNLQRVRFREVDTLFANPGQGWMSQQRSPNGATRFPCSVVYIRFDWVDVEPQEGQYNWEFIDDVISAWKPRGAAVGMRVMTANAHSGGYYSSPKWLFEAGCKGFEYNAGDGDPTSGGKAIPRIEPDYADPIYLAKHGAFIAALGRRYDGVPGVEFLDIGSYGIWGEWHTTHPAPVAVRQQIVDMYLQAFSKTLLVSCPTMWMSWAMRSPTGRASGAMESDRPGTSRTGLARRATRGFKAWLPHGKRRRWFLNGMATSIT